MKHGKPWRYLTSGRNLNLTSTGIHKKSIWIDNVFLGFDFKKQTNKQTFQKYYILNHIAPQKMFSWILGESISNRDILWRLLVQGWSDESVDCKQGYGEFRVLNTHIVKMIKLDWNKICTELNVNWTFWLCSLRVFSKKKSTYFT